MLEAQVRTMLTPRTQISAHQFKTFQYADTRDMEYFLTRNQKLAKTICWTEAARLLHLRKPLKGYAENCGHTNQVEAIFDALRVQFGLSLWQAQAELSALRITT